MGARTAGFIAGGIASVAGLSVVGYFHVLRHHDATSARLRRAEQDSRQAPQALQALNAKLEAIEAKR
eukprot:CAMPEP_0174851180 /NCGR_PEP_ID=MMETSP1114-20130205/22131_1 /TAXON_ID=312471 /ORGANISM="Neobodo designis, Strain CCAP 1951/1" /LENGTH=66 /DNA_ID=CAMNT_0016085697 /DNA_START=41 /DNA_END=241 /DNA_ORIENTATION=+